MTTEIREFRLMLDAGKRYLEGACSIQELNGRVSELAIAAKFWGGHSVLTQVATDWSAIVDRRWNEWGHSPNSVAEQEFQVWLEGQLGLLGQMPNNSFKPNPLRGSA